MNDQYIIMWDKKEINILKLNDGFCEENMKRIKFNIDVNDEKTFVKEVRAGSDPNMVVLVIN